MRLGLLLCITATASGCAINPPLLDTAQLERIRAEDSFITAHRSQIFHAIAASGKGGAVVIVPTDLKSDPPILPGSSPIDSFVNADKDLSKSLSPNLSCYFASVAEASIIPNRAQCRSWAEQAHTIQSLRTQNEVFSAALAPTMQLAEIQSSQIESLQNQMRSMLGALKGNSEIQGKSNALLKETIEKFSSSYASLLERLNLIVQRIEAIDQVRIFIIGILSCAFCIPGLALTPEDKTRLLRTANEAAREWEATLQRYEKEAAIANDKLTDLSNKSDIGAKQRIVEERAKEIIKDAPKGIGQALSKKTSKAAITAAKMAKSFIEEKKAEQDIVDIVYDTGFIQQEIADAEKYQSEVELNIELSAKALEIFKQQINVLQTTSTKMQLPQWAEKALAGVAQAQQRVEQRHQAEAAERERQAEAQRQREADARRERDRERRENQPRERSDPPQRDSPPQGDRPRPERPQRDPPPRRDAPPGRMP